MKKFVLWSYDVNEGEHAMLIDPVNIEEKIDLMLEKAVLFPCLENTEENRNWLESLMPKINELENISDIDELPEFENIEIDTAGDSETVRDMLGILETELNERFIFNLNELEEYKVYEYCDGGNFKEIWFNLDNMSETEVVVDEKNKENLDEWDGSNWFFEQKHNHGELYPIVEIDGELVSDKYLLERWSQFQGDIPTGEIIDKEDAEKLKKGN